MNQATQEFLLTQRKLLMANTLWTFLIPKPIMKSVARSDSVSCDDSKHCHAEQLWALQLQSHTHKPAYGQHHVNMPKRQA
jgi:hypothetical protein